MSRNAALREELLGTILATAPVGIAVVEPTTLRVLLANEQFRRYLDPEWHTRDLMGQPLDLLIPGMSGEQARATLAEITRTGEPQHFPEYRHDGFARGETYWQLDLSPVTNAHGMRVAAMYTATEITAHVRARQETEVTNAALASLAAISATITVSLDFDEVMDRLLTAVAPFIPYERAFVILEDGPDTLRIVAARYEGVREMALLGAHIPKSQSVNGRAFHTARPVFVRDFLDPNDEGYTRFRPPQMSAEFRSAICVPLVARERVIGTFYLTSHQPGAFIRTDLHRLERLAPQAAAAVANALLHREVTERAAELEAANDVAALVSSSLDFDETMDRVLTAIAPLVPFERALVLLDDGAEHVRVAAARQQGVQNVPIMGARLPKARSLAGHVMRTRCAISVPDADDPALLPPEGLYRFNLPDPSIGALLCVPLVARGAAIGALFLAQHTRYGYTDDDLHRLEQIAPQVASAVGNALLYRTATEHARESETLSEVATTVAASLAQPDVLDRILDQIGLVVGYDQAQLTIPERDGATLRVVSARGGGAEARVGATIPVAGSNTGRVFTEGGSVLVPDVSQTPEWIAGGYRLSQPLAHAHAAMLVPLRVHNETVGVIHLLRMEANGYDEADLRRLERFAPPIALALANAHLFAQAQERAVEFQTLSEVATTVAASLTLPDVLERVLTEIAAAVGYDETLIALADANDAELRVVSARGKRFAPTVGTDLPIAQSVSGMVFRENRSLLLADIAGSPEWQARMYDGTMQPAPHSRSSITMPLRAQGETLGVIVVVRDVAHGYDEADRARLERFAPAIALAIANARLYERVQTQVHELQHLNGNLADANRHKSEFLATMSHELRTPLNAILGFTELLREDLVPDPDERYLCLEDIYASAAHLLKLVNDVLDIAKIEAGAMKMRPEAFPLPEEIAEAGRVIAPLVAQYQHTLTVSHADDLPLVYADRGRVRQIVLNLLSNAVKFTPEGGSIRIVTDRVGAAARVRVIDTGIGIHPEDAHKVFEEFRQIDGSLSRKYEGTGLGLALSKRFVELQGGAISFESEPDVGTTFTLLLPLAAAIGGER